MKRGHQHRPLFFFRITYYLVDFGLHSYGISQTSILLFKDDPVELYLSSLKTSLSVF